MVYCNDVYILWLCCTVAQVVVSLFFIFSGHISHNAHHDGGGGGDWFVRWEFSTVTAVVVACWLGRTGAKRRILVSVSLFVWLCLLLSNIFLTWIFSFLLMVSLTVNMLIISPCFANLLESIRTLDLSDFWGFEYAEFSLPNGWRFTCTVSSTNVCIQVRATVECGRD